MGNIKIKRRLSRMVKLNKPDGNKRQQNGVTQRSWTVHGAGKEREEKTKKEKERRKDRNKRFEWQAMRR